MAVRTFVTLVERNPIETGSLLVVTALAILGILYIKLIQCLSLIG